MEQTNEQGWEVQRRVDGLVNKYMADIALETLQQRLSMVTEEMNHLSSELARRDDSSKRTDDTSRRADLNFNLGTNEPCGGAVFAGEKFPSSSSSETAAQRKILTLLVEIKEEQQRQWAVLRDLQARMQGGQRVCEDDDVETLDVDLPLRTMEHLDQTESYLEDAMAQKKMVSHLSRMGGATVDDAVRRLMQAVLSFAVGSELNWVGRGQKRSFRNTRLQGVLFRALKRTPVGREATHHQFADVVKKWLRFAPFRQGGTGRRQTMRPHTEYICPSFLTDSQCTDHPHVSPDPKDIKLY